MVIGRAGGFLSLEELEGLERSSLEAGAASWPEPEPISVIAKRVARGEHGLSAMPNGQRKSLGVGRHLLIRQLTAYAR